MSDSLLEFQDFPKMARLSREVIVTEKIDGTNAQICIEETGDAEERDAWLCDPFTVAGVESGCGAMRIRVGSRTRWITPHQDNFGFATWVEQNKEELFKLGPGRHFGEWWGAGIQRKYGLDHKRFSLFNTSRWEDDAVRPACCHVVPVLYKGVFSTVEIEEALHKLRLDGSVAAPGFGNPEGIVAYHVAAGVGFKKTIEKDESPKSLVGLS